MILKTNAVLLAAALLTLPVTVAFAQSSTGSSATTTSKTPKDQNPHVRGATGDAIVKGDRSTVAGDRKATNEQKTEQLSK